MLVLIYALGRSVQDYRGYSLALMLNNTFEKCHRFKASLLSHCSFLLEIWFEGYLLERTSPWLLTAASYLLNAPPCGYLQRSLTIQGAVVFGKEND